MRCLTIVVLAAVLALAACARTSGTLPPREHTAPEILAAWSRLNELRRAAGLRPVRLDERLSRGAALHAHYLLLNRTAPFSDASSPHPQFFADTPHDERPERPGYTKEGAEAARNSCLSYAGTPVESVDGFIASYHHRLPLLRRDLAAVGMASLVDGGQVVHVLRVRYEGVEDPSPFVYPVPEQRDVPLAFDGENPEPRPRDWFAGAVGGALLTGTPITVDFGPNQRVWGVKASIRTAGGSVLEAFTTWQEWAFRSTGAVLPRAVLSPNQTYQVELEATIDGRPWRKTWSFTTGAR